MDSVENEKAALIAGIEADAQAEEARIISEAEKQAEEKRQYAVKKAEGILHEAGNKSQEQAEAVRKKILSGVELEIQRKSMRLRGVAVQDVLELAEKKLASMVDDSGYREALLGWIAEAAVGLGAESAEVNASEAERRLIDQQMLDAAAAKAQQRTGKAVELKMSDSEPLMRQGVVLTASDGRTAFNNQVKTRLLRNQRQIRQAIYESLFGEKRKEQS